MQQFFVGEIEVINKKARTKIILAKQKKYNTFYRVHRKKNNKTLDFCLYNRRRKRQNLTQII